MRIPIQLLYRVRSWLFATFRVKTRGVKVMVLNAAGEVLLVRNSYGKTHLHVFPGGGIRPFESLADAARREIREEVGIEVQQLAFFATYHSQAEGRRDTLHLFTASTEDSPTSDSYEIAEAAFYPLDALPETTSPATVQRIEEYRGRQPVTGLWRDD